MQQQEIILEASAHAEKPGQSRLGSQEAGLSHLGTWPLGEWAAGSWKGPGAQEAAGAEGTEQKDSSSEKQAAGPWALHGPRCSIPPPRT